MHSCSPLEATREDLAEVYTVTLYVIKNQGIYLYSTDQSPNLTTHILKSSFYTTQYIVILAMLSALFNHSQHHAPASLCTDKEKHL